MRPAQPLSPQPMSLIVGSARRMDLANCTVFNNVQSNMRNQGGGVDENFQVGGLMVEYGGIATNCVIANNTAVRKGGGAIVYGGGMLVDCVISNNSTPSDGYIGGLGIGNNCSTKAPKCMEARSAVTARRACIWAGQAWPFTPALWIIV